jgi:hypothetical protein
VHAKHGRKKLSEEKKGQIRTVVKASGSGGLSVRIPPEDIDYLQIEQGDYLVFYQDVNPRTKERILITKKIKV